MQQKNSKQVYKFVVLGDQAVGKTSILKQYTVKELPKFYQPTQNTYTFATSIKLQDQSILVRMIDIFGWEKFKGVDSSSLFKDIDGIILFYDINIQKTCDTLEQIKKDLMKIYEVNISEFPIIVIANKIDQLKNDKKLPNPSLLNQEKDITKSDKFFECSANNNEGLDQAFEKLAQQVVDTLENQSIQEMKSKFKQPKKEKNCQIF